MPKKLGRPPLKAALLRSRRFWFRCNQIELRDIEAAAKAAGQEAGTWARDVLLREARR
jgi:hypothetical protein